MLEHWDFTLLKYAELCKNISKSRYTCVTMKEFLLNDVGRTNNYLILRHDIDRMCRNALDTAKVEKEYDLQATYYFRYAKNTYNLDIIDKIAALGHEIGYHYETLDRCKGDRERAKVLFSRELGIIRQNYEIKTVCAHGNPLTPYDNKSIWNELKLEDFGLLGEAFLCLDFTKFAYFSDSGRTWYNSKTQKMPGKDDVKTAFDSIFAKNTDQLIEIINKGGLPNLCILTHPERWNKNLPGFIFRYCVDLVFSLGKTGITLYRGVKSNKPR